MLAALGAGPKCPDPRVATLIQVCVSAGTGAAPLLPAGTWSHLSLPAIPGWSPEGASSLTPTPPRKASGPVGAHCAALSLQSWGCRRCSPAWLQLPLFRPPGGRSGEAGLRLQNPSLIIIKSKTVKKWGPPRYLVARSTSTTVCTGLPQIPGHLRTTTAGAPGLLGHPPASVQAERLGGAGSVPWRPRLGLLCPRK